MIKGSSITARPRLRRLWLRCAEPETGRAIFTPVSLLHLKAQVLYITGDWTRSESIYRLVLRAAELAGDSGQAATFKCHLGLVLYNLGNYDEALQLEQAAFDHDIADGNLAQAVKPLTNIGNIHKGRGDLEKALDSYNRALELAKQSNDEHDIGICLGDIGLIHWYRGENGLAMTCYLEKLAIAERMQDLYNLETTYANIGSVRLTSGDLSEAERYYRLQLDIALRIGDRASERVAYNNLCGIFENRGDFRLMLEFYTKSFKIAEEMGNRSGMRIVLGNLGTVHQQLGQFEKAEQLFRRSLALARELGDKRGTGIALCSLGVLHRKLGDMTSALRELEEAVGLLEPIRANDYLTEAQYQLALTMMVSGDRDQAGILAERCLRDASALGRDEYVYRSRLLQLELGLGADGVGMDDAAAALRSLAPPPGRPDLEAERLYLLWLATGGKPDRDAALAALHGLAGKEYDPEIIGRIARLEPAP